MKSIRELLPRASQDCVDLNPLPAVHTSDAVAANVAPRRGKSMTKPEREMAMILECKKRQGDISRYVFEGITLRWQCGTKPDGTPIYIKYTPDFIVFNYAPREHEFKLIEVKGPFIKGNRERAVERFRHAKTYWPEFTFEMWQCTKDGWKQII